MVCTNCVANGAVSLERFILRLFSSSKFVLVLVLFEDINICKLQFVLKLLSERKSWNIFAFLTCLTL